MGVTSRMAQALVPFMLMATGGCGATHPGTGPDDMSAEEHRHRAREHEGRADGHEGQYAGAASRRLPTSVGLAVVPRIDADSVEVGQIQPHDAASSNPSSASSRCSAKERESSPLSGQVVEVQPIPQGVRLVLALMASAERMMPAIRYHQAFARERHFEGAPHCPLFVSNVDAVPEPDGRAIRLLTSGGEAAVKHLRARSRQLVRAAPSGEVKR
jgi:hypothetical protein